MRKGHSWNSFKRFIFTSSVPKWYECALYNKYTYIFSILVVVSFTYTWFSGNYGSPYESIKRFYRYSLIPPYLEEKNWLLVVGEWLIILISFRLYYHTHKEWSHDRSNFVHQYISEVALYFNRYCYLIESVTCTLIWGATWFVP